MHLFNGEFLIFYYNKIIFNFFINEDEKYLFVAS